MPPAATAVIPRDLDVPIMGIMTKTLIPNSIVKQIIPARIRDKNKNDVIFVTDDSIEIKEYHSDGYLEHVVRKSDFGSKIVSACCFGDSRTLVKSEPNSPRGFASLLGQHPHCTSTGTKSQNVVPPKILAIVVESGVLSFLFAYHDFAGSLRFKSSSPSQLGFAKANHLKQSGKHMTVDPTSTLLALVPQEGYITLACLKPLSEIREELKTGIGLDPISFDPIIKARVIAIKGLVLKMEFLVQNDALKDSNSKETLIAFIVITSYKGRTRLHRYEWDSTTDIGEFKEVGTGHVLSSEEQSPLLLIPITVVSGFLLVCEKRAFLYGNTSHGCWEPPWPLNLNDEEIHGVINDSEEAESSPQERGSSSGAPLWTQWTRPMRRADWLTNYDAIYVCREDGVVKYLLIETNGNRPTVSKCRVGNIKSNVDLAVACIDNGTEGTWHEDGRESEDVLVTGGSMGDGALYRFKGRQNAQKGQNIPSLAPILDICSVPETVLKVPTTSTNQPDDMISPYNGQDNLFACIGRGPRHGAVCEIRYGTQASVGMTLVLPDPTFLGLWALSKLSDDGKDIETLMLVTDPQQTQMVDEIGEAVPMEEFGLDSTTQTIAAGSYSDGITIQVTHQAIRVTTLWSNPSTALRIEKDVVTAAVGGIVPATLACIRQGDDVSLHLVAFRIEEDHIVQNLVGLPLPLETGVTSLCLYSNAEEFIALAGNLDHKLQIYLGTPTHGFRMVQEIPLFEYRVSPIDKELIICNSIAMITGRSKGLDSDGWSVLALCGLRTGKLEIYKISVLDEEVQVTWQETFVIGETFVEVIPEAISFDPKSRMGTCTRALVRCDNKVCRLSQEPAVQGSAGLHKSRIWLVDHKEPGQRLSSIKAIAQPDIWTVIFMDGNIKPNLFCIEGANIHFADIDTFTEPQALPRPILIGGTPSRMIYSQRLWKLIVGFTKTIVKDLPTQKRRLHFPMVTMLQPYQDFSTRTHESSTIQPMITPQNIGDSGERILGILEWFPYWDPAKVHHFIVINTMRKRKGQRPPTGRILFYHYQEGNDIEPLVKKAVIKQEEPVYALAAYGTQSLVHSTGTELVLQELSTSVDGKWKIKKIATATLPSLGSFISVHDDFVYVTTKAHSVVVYRVSHDRLAPAYGDEVARDTTRHFSQGGKPITIVADTNGIVAGLWQPPFASLNKSFSTVFEAKLPASVTRFFNAAHLIPPWYRHDLGRGARIVIGTSMSGAMYQFETLAEHEWRLLKFVQNLLEPDPFISPVSYTGALARKYEPRENVPLAKHVDGDILARLLRYDQPTPESLLSGIMEAEWDPDSDNEDIMDVAKRRARFEELLARAWGWERGEDPFVYLVDRLRTLLRPTM